MRFKHFFYFVYHETFSCLFALLIFITLAASHYFPSSILPRYDFIFAMCILFQVFLVYFKYETKEEVKIIFIFHIVGFLLELFKVHVGSWSYPEKAYTKFFGVPLYSGFMYSSVASYISQIWKRLDLQLNHVPPFWFSFILGILIYLNFFTHHYIYDFRWILIGLLVLFYGRSWIHFTLQNHTYKIPYLLSFFLIGLFIWFAENISTFFGAWTYPDQQEKWHIVSFEKINSWFLLVIISFLIVSFDKHREEKQKKAG